MEHRPKAQMLLLLVALGCLFLPPWRPALGPGSWHVDLRIAEISIDVRMRTPVCDIGQWLRGWGIGR